MTPCRRIVAVLAAAAFSAAPAAVAAADTPETGGVAAPTGNEPILATAHVMLDGVVEFSGRFGSDAAGRTVAIERYDEEGQTWSAVARATVGDDGRYAASWRPDAAGRFRTRAMLAPASESLAVLRAAGAGTAEATVTVYRPALASWYGPGFFGRRTACGRRMTRRLLGVAHRSLPCGTPVALTYRGSSITVPVVDRGPFVAGRKWDLTAATAKRLGFTYTDRLGAVRLD